MTKGNVMTNRHSETQTKEIIDVLTILDGRAVYIAKTHNQQQMLRWMKFNARVDMFLSELDSLRPNYNDVEQVDHKFTSQEIKKITHVMQILDNDVKTGNVDSAYRLSYAKLVNQKYFQTTFETLVKELELAE